MRLSSNRARQNNPSRTYWSMTEGVWNCLIDKKRTQAFIRAIRDAIRPGDVVVDAGTGSGVLAMASVRAGAAHVYAIESDPSNIRWLTEAFVKNGYSDKITLIDGDATRCSLSGSCCRLLSVSSETDFRQMIALAMRNPRGQPQRVVCMKARLTRHHRRVRIRQSRL